MKRITILSAAALVAALLAGCDNKPAPQAAPEVNDENCKPENIRKIADPELQRTFADTCFLRGGSFHPSSGRIWKPGTLGESQ